MLSRKGETPEIKCKKYLKLRMEAIKQNYYQEAGRQ